MLAFVCRPQSQYVQLRLSWNGLIIYAGTFIASSPWTLSLYESLGSALEVEGHSDGYAAVLKNRLLVHGATLMTKVNCASKTSKPRD